MAPNSADSLTKRHELELARLKRGSHITAKRLTIAGFFILLVLLVSVRFLYRYSGDTESIESARQLLVQSAGVWGQDFSDSQEHYYAWLLRRGTSIEIRLFGRLSQGLFESAGNFAGRYDDPGLLARMYLGLHGGVLRVGFILIAAARLWFVVIGAFLWIGLRPLGTWRGRDALGQTGNGKIFFSGVRVGLDNPTPDGAPSEQITGLACPAATSLPQARATALAKVLALHGATTTTNLRLVAIIDAHKDIPAYIAAPGEEAELSSFFEGAELAMNAEQLLHGALTLHASYRGESDSEPVLRTDLGELLKAARQGRKLTAAEYGAIVVDALDRVLTSKSKESLALLDAASVATVVLALEAGKSLAYAKEGGRWARKSNFPQLSARAVLHSVPEFALEYDFDLRATIRRALIFGARSSVFAPVKFPVDLRAESRAARQWVELLMATPHRLTTLADEVQLLGLVGELHQKWEQGFFDGAQALDPEVIDQAFATPQNLLFMPVSRVVALLRRATDPAEISQLEALVAVVSQEQRRRVTSRSNPQEGEDEKGIIPSYERIFAPFTPQETANLTAVHGVSAEDARAWSSFRVVLNAYGWLGRRVADRSVPESSVVFSVSTVGADFNDISRWRVVSHRRRKIAALRAFETRIRQF
ncbi:MAG: hypothetical protein EBZ48_12270 [Proteobacteria bacterium]|nr:hypothetical protein [Pseudomonadota bacterium]